MRIPSRSGTLAFGCLLLTLLPTPSWAQKVELINNHAFPVRMPWLVRGVRVHRAEGAAARTDLAVQETENGTVVMVDLPASSSKVLDIAADGRPSAGEASVRPAKGGLRLTYRQQDMGLLSFGVVVRPAAKPEKGKEDLAGAGKPELAFTPLNLSFMESGGGSLFNTCVAGASASGLELRIVADVYRVGFLDLTTTVLNRAASQKNVYAAVIMRWEGRPVSRAAGYDSRFLDLGADASTPWRKGGERHLFVQRGVDWIVSRFDSGNCAMLLNAFAPSFTYHKEATARTPAQWIGANGPQLAQEAYTDARGLYCVTELAHPNIKSYRSRVQDNILPDDSRPMTWRQRFVFHSEPVTPKAADEAFVAYSGFNEQSQIGDLKSQEAKSRQSAPASVRVSFGVPFARFGTAYFPFSTLGENFMTQRLPGMSQDTYWPLAADIVRQYPLFADEIRRDLRIMKAMGFESDRLHHLEMLYATGAGGKEYCTAAERDAFLDFYFGELGKVGITALLDVKLPADEIARLVRRYRPHIDGVEIDNEVLIFGIKDGDAPQWKEVYAAVKRVAPDMPVHLTAHTNTGAFLRLDQLGVPYDRIGQHAYQDGLDAIPSGRGFALQAASFATQAGKPPVITEWNWRFMTRMTERARAAVYAPIFENIVQSRCMPMMYQFQFNDSLAMNPEGLKGIRHYELLNLSRRPKEEAAVFQRLVDTYSAPDSGPRMLGADRVVVDFKDGAASGQVHLKNRSSDELRLAATIEADVGVQGALPSAEQEVVLGTGASGSLAFTLKLPPDALPGFYHSFVRLEDKQRGLLRYAWIEGRNAGSPRIEKDAASDVVCSANALDFELNRPLAVVYGDECPILELEAAWVIYQSLESATGRPVAIYTLAELPEEFTGGVIYCGTPRSLPVITADAAAATKFIVRVPTARGDALAVAGNDSRNAALAAMDFTLRYWRFAKDAACRRIPLVPNTTFKGPDAGQLP